MKKYLYLLLFPTLLGFVSCGGNDDSEKEQIDAKELFRKKLIGTWVLQTYITDAYTNKKDYLNIKNLSTEQINYYGLEGMLDITFTDYNFYYSQTVKEDPHYKNRENIFYEIKDWNKNWGDEYFEYYLRVYFPNSIYYVDQGGAKFMDNNTLKWMGIKGGYIFKRK